MKKRNLIILFGIFMLMLNMFIISTIKADVTPTGSEYSVENVDANSEGGVSSSSSNHIFYSETYNRWYVVYVYRDGLYAEYVKYAYSDLGDPTTWNQGGVVNAILGNTWTNYLKPPYNIAWCWDEENLIGHFTYSIFTGNYLKYCNFTISEETGEISFGSKKTLHFGNINTALITVDIATLNNTVFLFSYGKHNDINGFLGCLWIFPHDNYENRNMTYWRPFTDYYTAPNIIPINSTTALCLAVTATTGNPIRAKVIVSGVTENSTDTGMVFSDNNVYYFSGINGYKIVSYGSSYNSTHGCIAYSGESSKDVYAFIFDFETLTRGDEYLAYDVTVGGHVSLSADVTVNENEFFVLTITGFTSTGQVKDMYLTEQHNLSYSGYFNASGAVLILNDFATDWDYTYLGSSISKFTDTSDRTIVLFEDGDYAKVTVIEVVGEYEYSPPPPPPEERGDPFDWGNVKYMLALLVFFIIAVFAIYIKRS